MDLQLSSQHLSDLGVNMAPPPGLIATRSTCPLPLTGCQNTHPAKQPPAASRSYVAVTRLAVVVGVPSVTQWWGIHQLHCVPTDPTVILPFLKVSAVGRT